MKRIKNTQPAERIIAALLAGILFITMAVSGTMAWADLSQHRTNVAQGEGPPKPGNAQLEKYERDADGKETQTAIPGVEFSLYKQDSTGAAQLVRSYKTGADGTILASDLEPGTYYWQETAPAQGYLPDVEDGQAKKYPFTIPGEDDKPVVTKAYNSRQLGKLGLTKTVRNSDNSPLSTQQQEQLFEFTVVFGDGGSYVCKIDGAAPQTVASGGKIYLKSGQSAAFEEIPAGVYYMITETASSEYIISSDNHAGNVLEEGITAAFTNTRKAEPPSNGSLVVTKTVTGEEVAAGMDFLFTAVIGGETHTFLLKNGESKRFDNLPLGTAYTVTESDPRGAGYTPMVGHYSGAIQVGGIVITLPFANHYEQPPVPPPAGSLEISKTVAQGSQDTPFSFTVSFTGDGAPASPQSFTLQHGEKKVFENIPQGVQYVVTEASQEGIYADFTTASGEIASGETAKVGFINREKEKPQPLQLTVKKQVDGNAPEKDSDKLFHFTLTINNEKHEFDLKPGETSQAFAVAEGDRYTLQERDYIADGYVQSAVSNGTGTVGKTDIVIVQVNTYKGPEKINIAGEKTWEMPAGTKLPESVTILLKCGTMEIASAKVTKADNWRYEFKDLPKRDALGNVIVYTVEEVRQAGWRPVVTGYDVKNHYQPAVTDDAMEVEKMITGTPEKDEAFEFILTALGNAPMPETAAVTITGKGKASFGKITYTLPGTYVYTITETNGKKADWSYDASVYTMTVKVTENEKTGQLEISRELTKTGKPADAALFTNTYNPGAQTISIRVTKIWRGGEEGSRPASVKVQMFKDGTEYEDARTLSAGNNWTSTWSELEKGHDWTVQEIDVPKDYTCKVEGDPVNGFIVINTKKDTPAPETTSVKVTKVWKGDDEKRPASVAMQLYKSGKAHGLPVTLSADNQWTYTWTRLEKGAAWTVDEINVPAGYSKAAAGDAANGFVITNTKLPGQPGSDEEITVSGKKTWHNGENTKPPESITVIVRSDGAIVTQRLVTAAEHWSWAFKLPKYNDAGKEIAYAVDEVAMDDYVKTVDGYNLINTYSPGANTDDPAPLPGDGDGDGKGGTDGPKTDDSSNLVLWVSLLGVSAAGLAALGITVLVKRRKKREKIRG